jgi:hypothetical protein
MPGGIAMKLAGAVIWLALVFILARFVVPFAWKRYTRWRWKRFRNTLYVPERWEHSDRERSA